MRQREKRSKRAAKPSSASGGSSTEPWPTAWKKPAIGSSLSRVCRRANGAAFAPRMQSNGYTRNSSAGSRRRPCCRRQTPPPCCSGRCSLPVRSTCARSMDGKPLLQNPSISQLTSQLDPIPSVTRRLRRAKFQPHHGRHPNVRTWLTEPVGQERRGGALATGSEGSGTHCVGGIGQGGVLDARGG